MIPLMRPDTHKVTDFRTQNVWIYNLFLLPLDLPFWVIITLLKIQEGHGVRIYKYWSQISQIPRILLQLGPV